MPNAPKIRLNEGDQAPAFTAACSGGGQVSLSDFKGQRVVLYFYPRDQTPGCTKEACGFRESHTKLKARNAVVLGISKDSVKSHDKFVERFRLPFLLLSDEDTTIAKAYGAWGEKRFMGRKFMGMHRMTFLIDAEGHITKVWTQVKPDQHAAEVLAQLEAVV